MNTSKTTLKLVELAILTAIIIVFQSLGAIVHIGPVSISLVLVPIVVGGCIIGVGGGAFLGLVFGVMTLVGGISGADGFTNILFTDQPAATSFICIAKAVLCGAGAGAVFKLLKDKNLYLASLAAAAAAPIINTGIFILGGLFLVNKTLEANLANFGAEGMTLVYFVIIGCAGLNFIAEFLLNVIVSPAIPTVYRAVGNQKKS